VAEAILAGRVAIGWTRDRVREAWGRPSVINRNTTGAGTVDTWYYGAPHRGEVVFERNVVSAIQD
jgi:hypothetical protein